ncbi:hypothetical protein HID58_057170, partial [Brassica napus]
VGLLIVIWIHKTNQRQPISPSPSSRLNFSFLGSSSTATLIRSPSVIFRLLPSRRCGFSRLSLCQMSRWYSMHLVEVFWSAPLEIFSPLSGGFVPPKVSWGQVNSYGKTNDLSCKLSEESFSSRCDIEVFRHLELCRKHAAHDLSVFLRIPEEARELEKQPTQVTKESMSLCEAKYLR